MKYMRTERFAKPHNPTHSIRGLAPSKVETLLHGVSVAEQIENERQQARAVEFAARREAQQQQLQAKYELRAQQQQEKEMAGLKESLEKAIVEKAARAAKLDATLAEWDDDEDAPAPEVNIATTKETNPMQFTETQYITAPTVQTPPAGSISQGTFDYVRSHPNNTTRHIVERLHTLYGYNTTSTTSLISQMVRQGRISRENGVLLALYDRYSPIKVKPKAAKVAHKQVKITVNGQDIAAPAGGIATLTKPPVAHSISSLLDNISVNEARALYLELKKLFGGN